MPMTLARLIAEYPVWQVHPQTGWPFGSSPFPEEAPNAVHDCRRHLKDPEPANCRRFM